MNRPSHILLVEDNPDDCEATLRSFKKNRFTNSIHWCRTGKDALDYLRQTGAYAESPEVQAPDIVLLDLNMPGLDGRQVLQIVKSDEALKSIPVIILTTSRDSKDVDQCYAFGANTYIQKPVNFEELTQSIGAMKSYWFDVAVLPERQE